MSEISQSQEKVVLMRQLTEAEVMQLLLPMQKDVLDEFEKGIKAGNFNFIKLYLEYCFGKPKQQAEDNTSGVIEAIRFIDGKETV